MISYRFNEKIAEQYGNQTNVRMVKKALATNALSEALQIQIRNAFSSDCCVVFSDISGFSATTHNMSTSNVKDFLDDYYARIIPIIYEHGGLIDQMIGDGIISVYSSDLSPEVEANVFDVGLHAAKEIVETFAGSETLSTKCALHKDAAIVCELGDGNYRQATLVGPLLTILHRIESVARDEAVNMLHSLPEAREKYALVKLQSSARSTTRSSHPTWLLNTFDAQLKGVGSEIHKILYWQYNR